MASGNVSTFLLTWAFSVAMAINGLEFTLNDSLSILWTFGASCLQISPQLPVYVLILWCKLNLKIYLRYICYHSNSVRTKTDEDSCKAELQRRTSLGKTQSLRETLSCSRAEASNTSLNFVVCLSARTTAWWGQYRPLPSPLVRSNTSSAKPFSTYWLMTDRSSVSFGFLGVSFQLPFNAFESCHSLCIIAL